MAPRHGEVEAIRAGLDGAEGHPFGLRARQTQHHERFQPGLMPRLIPRPRKVRRGGGVDADADNRNAVGGGCHGMACLMPARPS
jgi:hypothetical protein